MRKLPMLITAGLLSATLATASMAGPRGGCNQGADRSQAQDRLMSQLDLSAEQQSAIDALRNQQREQKKAQRDARKQRPQIRATPDQADYEQQVQAYAKQKAAAVEAKILQKAKMKADIYALLTPQQQSKLLELRREMKEKRSEDMREMRREKREARELEAS